MVKESKNVDTARERQIIQIMMEQECIREAIAGFQAIITHSRIKIITI